MITSKQITIHGNTSHFMVLSRRIASAVMDLEDLYLSEKRLESNNKLIMRVTKILGFFGYDKSEVVKNLKQACDIRNNFLLHSRLAKKKDQRYLKALAKKVFEYLRITMLVILSDSFSNKSCMIKLIDDAIKCDDANQELRNKLEAMTNLTRME